MLEVNEAVELLKSEINRCNETVTLDILEAKGYVTGEDIYATINVPPFPKSAMDGYAVKAQDTINASKEAPLELNVIGELLAGDYKEIEYVPNSAVRIMTGAMVPKEYDCIVRQEDTDYGEEKVLIYTIVKPYQNYCKVGEDIREGSLLIKAGTLLTSMHIGLLASMGIDKVLVVRPMKVSIISTGSELMEPGTPLYPGKIYNNISYILNASLTQKRVQVVRRVLCEDTIENLIELVNDSTNDSDVIITTGAVSVGKKDILPETMDTIGATRIFRGLNIQPGTPTMASVYKGKIILSLSGNPYAALANFELFFWEILSKYLGADVFQNIKKSVILKSNYEKISKHRRLIRAYEENGEVTIPYDVHASSVISNMVNCNCFINVPENTKIAVGDTVEVIMFNL